MCLCMCHYVHNYTCALLYMCLAIHNCHVLIIHNCTRASLYMCALGSCQVQALFKYSLKTFLGMQKKGKDIYVYIQVSSVQFKPVQFSSIQVSSVQVSSIQVSSDQFKSVQFNSSQFSSIQL